MGTSRSVRLETGAAYTIVLGDGDDDDEVHAYQCSRS